MSRQRGHDRCSAAVAAAAVLMLLVAASGDTSTRQPPVRATANDPEVIKGSTLFAKPFTVADGLGPAFNAVSCASCHGTPRAGGSGSAEHTFVAWSYTDPGDTLGMPRQRFVIASGGRHRPLRVDTVHRRATPSLFGVGLLEAVPVETLSAHADPHDADGDGISGRLPWRDDCYGRFGWQSTVCDIPSFVAGALSNEIGIDALRRSRPEMSPADLASLSAYVRRLDAPIPSVLESGADLFAAAACSSCHRVVTGEAMVGGQRAEVRAYTDLLLHEFGDAPRHVQQGSRTEFRTPPLWGLSQRPGPYLHDGSARSVRDAILRHGGEARRARELFVRLLPADQRRLVLFVASR
jgi:CxxC motif-containing protein (DUF1111 family)